MNVLADREATKALANAQDQPQFLPMPNCSVYVVHRGRYLTSRELNYCRDILPSQRIKDYYVKRHEWQSHDTVDWEAYCLARQRNPHLHRFTTKLGCKALPTNKKLAQRGGGFTHLSGRVAMACSISSGRLVSLACMEMPVAS